MKVIKVCIGYILMASALLMISSQHVNGQDSEKAADSKEAPWYNIKYECYSSDAEGLEILQEVKNSGDDFLDIVIHLRFNDLHSKFHRNVLLTKVIYNDESWNPNGFERWIALHNAGENNGTVWTSPETIRIPRTWSFDLGSNPYTATWDDDRQRYRLSNWPDEQFDNLSLESDLFGVKIECYQYDVESPRWPQIIDLNQQ